MISRIIRVRYINYIRNIYILQVLQIKTKLWSKPSQQPKYEMLQVTP